MATQRPHSTPPGPLKRRNSEGVHFTWLLQTGREDDLDLVSDDDNDDAMVQLDEEYIGEMERRAALRDQEQENEDSDMDQLEHEDARARAEYDDGPTLVSPRGERDRMLRAASSGNVPRPPPGCFHRTMHHIPCTTCCFPMDGNSKPACTPERTLKVSKRFCMPNFELLRTLRVVKHVRIFQKILSGTSKASYYEVEVKPSESSTQQASDTDLGLSETEVNRESLSRDNSMDYPNGQLSPNHPANASSVEVQPIVKNENTGESSTKTTETNASSAVEQVELDLESGPNVVTHEDRSNGLEPHMKPSWDQRKRAAMRRAVALGKETIANIKPGFITALVNFPLVLAVAGGVGAHPYYGLNAAFWAALAAVFFAGSRYTIAAPTMLLTSNLVAAVNEYGMVVLPIISLLAALTIYALIFTRAIEFVTFVPSMTTHGVTLGTSVLVIIYQVKFAVGLPGDIHAPSVPYYVVQLVRDVFSQSNWMAIFMFVVSMIITYFVIRWGQGLPPVAVLFPLGILAGYLLDRLAGNQDMRIPYIDTLGTRYGHVEFHPVVLNHWQLALFNWTVLGKAMEIAFICVMESYSTANLTYEVTGKRYSKGHEMFSLATANLISGLFGGMPTSVGVTRVLLNIRSGASSRSSCFVNGLCMLVFAITMTSWLRWFPLPVVAAIQITAAWRSVDPKVWAKVFREDIRAAASSFITATLCVVINPFIGLLIGIIVSMSIFSRQLSKGHSELTVKTKVHKLRVARNLLTPEQEAGLVQQFAQGNGLATPPPTPRQDELHSSAPSISITGASSANLDLSKRGSTTNVLAMSLPTAKNQRPLSTQIPKQLFQASFTDLPASRTLSIRHAMAQLQPLLDIESDGERDVKYNVVVYRISGVLTFINSQTHYETVKAITRNNVACLIFNLRFLYYVDYDGQVMLRNLVEHLDKKLSISTYLVGVTSDLQKILKKEPWYKQKRKENLVWKLESDAFKDIQARNAELIEADAELAEPEFTTVTAPPSDAEAILDKSSPASVRRTNTSRSLKVSQAIATPPPLQRVPSISVNMPTTNISSSITIKKSQSTKIPKLSFAARQASVSSISSSKSRPVRRSSRKNSKPERSPSYVSQQEMEEAISSPASAHGADPAEAVASNLRANQLRRSLLASADHHDQHDQHSPGEAKSSHSDSDSRPRPRMAVLVPAKERITLQRRPIRISQPNSPDQGDDASSHLMYSPHSDDLEDDMDAEDENSDYSSDDGDDLSSSSHSGGSAEYHPEDEDDYRPRPRRVLPGSYAGSYNQYLSPEDSDSPLAANSTLHAAPRHGPANPRNQSYSLMELPTMDFSEVGDIGAHALPKRDSAPSLPRPHIPPSSTLAVPPVAHSPAADDLHSTTIIPRPSTSTPPSAQPSTLESSTAHHPSGSPAPSTSP